MDIGAFNKRIKIEEPVFTVNDEGGREAIHEELFTAWAKVSDVNKYGDNGQITGIRGRYKFTVRYSSKWELVNKGWLIVYENRFFTIDNLEKIKEQNYYLIIEANEKE